MWVYPRGNGSGKDKSVSLYLGRVEDRDKLPKDWKVTADLSLSMINQHDPEKSRKVCSASREFYTFKSWGCCNLIPLTDFHDAAKGFLVNDTVTFQAKIEVKKPAKTS